MANLLDRLRAWVRRSGADESGADNKKSDDWKDVGETHRPSGALGHGSSVPPGYVPPADEGRPPH
jgi:hypothetical protein